MRHPHLKQTGAPREHGFTLLEVLLAFAILSVVTTLMSQIISFNVEKAVSAIDQREMRELADTVFGKILFEQTEHRDGDEGSIAVDYGKWAGLPQERADRYEIYRWRLVKREMMAAGQSGDEDDSEDIFGEEDEDEEETSSDPGAGGEQRPGVKLIKFTMVVFRRDQPDEALITLTRYLKPPDFGDAAGN